MFQITRIIIGSSFVFSSFLMSANAQEIFDEDIFETNDASLVRISGSIGVLSLEAKEHVFNGAGSADNLSLLIWQTTAPILKTSLSIDVSDGWSFDIDAQAAMSGTSYMENYDWLLPYRPSFASNDWTDRSIHENTNLDWYLKGAMALGYKFDVANNASIKLKGGIQYIDVQWAAVGGTYDYSIGAFRDSSGTFADIPGITYRQQLPSVFIGLDASAKQGDWTFDVGAKAGITFAASATDWHWMRDLRFEESIVPAPTLALDASISYSLSEDLDIFVSGSVEKTFLGRSDTTIYVNSSNINAGIFSDASGAELFSASASIGLKAKM